MERTHVSRHNGAEFPQIGLKLLLGAQICLIDERPFIRECIRNTISSFSELPVLSFESAGDYKQFRQDKHKSLIIVVCADAGEDFLKTALADLADLRPTVPTVVLGPPRSSFLNIAIAHGARGYIAFTTKFDVVIEIIRVILAGGTYVPMDCLPLPEGSAATEADDPGARPFLSLTPRELSVVRSIQQGKSNKAIAYALSMTESTVKAHVRNVMAKLSAKNRTDVAMLYEKLRIRPVEGEGASP